MKTLHEWPRKPILFGMSRDGKTMLVADPFIIDTNQKAERQHWLDMAHPLPKRKGAK